MPALKLEPHRVEKPWGRLDIPPVFSGARLSDRPIGEVWFKEPGDARADLLVKYLFTSEKLSVQVHPDDAQAQAHGLPRGKDECWFILSAEPDSTIALGPAEPMTAAELRTAAEDGSLEAKLVWRPVRAGDFLYAPSGTVHAIGAGITLLEVQQNSETTYRLYDYGRPRDLHLDAGVAVSRLEPYRGVPPALEVAPQRHVYLEGPTFVLERRTGGGPIALAGDASALLIPLAGRGNVAGVTFAFGDCVEVRGLETIHSSEDLDVFVAYAGATRVA